MLMLTFGIDKIMTEQSDLLFDFDDEPQHVDAAEEPHAPTDAENDKNTDTMSTAQEPRSYSTDEIMQSSIAYFGGDELAANVWMNKYALRDGDKIYELNPDMMHRRLAREFARIEAKYPNPLSEEDIYQLLKDFRYLVPQGSPMSGIGNNYQVVSLSNCFVIGNAGNSDSFQLRAPNG